MAAPDLTSTPQWVAQSPPRVLRGGPDNDFLLRLLGRPRTSRPALHVRVWRGSGFVFAWVRGQLGAKGGGRKEQGMFFFFLRWGQWQRTCRAKPSSWASSRSRTEESSSWSCSPAVPRPGSSGRRAERGRAPRRTRRALRPSLVRNAPSRGRRPSGRQRETLRSSSPKTGLKRIAGHAVRERLPSSRVLESGISRHPRRYFFPRKSGQKKKEKRSRDRTPGTENGRVPAARVARARTRTERIGTKDDASLDSAAYLCS